MRYIEIIAELLYIGFKPWNWILKPPTDESIDRIQSELSVSIPESYIDIARLCPNYATWLGGIGEDYEHGLHILNLNREFRINDREEGGYLPLPPNFVMINHGHDGDCDCFDISKRNSFGEHPISYICLEADDAEAPEIKYDNFLDYITENALFSISNPRNNRDRQRTKALMEMGGDRLANAKTKRQS